MVMGMILKLLPIGNERTTITASVIILCWLVSRGAAVSVREVTSGPEQQFACQQWYQGVAVEDGFYYKGNKTKFFIYLNLLWCPLHTGSIP
jgi:hypothetical protein